MNSHRIFNLVLTLKNRTEYIIQLGFSFSRITIKRNLRKIRLLHRPIFEWWETYCVFLRFYVASRVCWMIQLNLSLLRLPQSKKMRCFAFKKVIDDMKLFFFFFLFVCFILFYLFIFFFDEQFCTYRLPFCSLRFPFSGIIIWISHLIFARSFLALSLCFSVSVSLIF